ncbi:MAG: class I SAM-dependent methyltransferase [Candidatus Binatia bacterium]|nr:class I SAM-dependent methyltransferase [Candidatus Binatia bacterium]
MRALPFLDWGAKVYSDKLKWEARYRDGKRATTAPAPLLVQWHHLLQAPVLDLAGGNGRNALFLARRRLPVQVIDIAHVALQHLMRNARPENLPISAIAADLEHFPLPHQRYGGIVIFHYLQRDLFDGIRAALRPGGVVIYETFLVDQQKIGHPRNPNHLLQRGELLAHFADFELLLYEEGLLEYHPPAYLARLVARRPNKAAGAANTARWR